jgi:hypothetical protein
MPDQNEEKSRIIVDSDWKSEAQREKEEMDRETREMPQIGQIPDPSILELLQMVVMQATIGLGGFQDPQTGQRIPPNLALAKHYIDLVELMQKKTQGNLDEEENSLMTATLHELRQAFVQVAGALGQGEPGGPGGAPKQK